MKERPKRKYRPFLVSWNEHRCISNMTKEELYERLEIGDVDWVNLEGKRIDIADIEPSSGKKFKK